MRELPKEGELFKHQSGELFNVICIARDPETLEEMVVYGSKDDPLKKFVRPLKIFMGEMEIVNEPAQETGGEKATDTGEVSEDLLAFLDAGTNEEKLDVLYSIRSRLDDETINAIAVSLDTEIRAGSIADRYEEIRDYLSTMIKYEGARMRP